MTDQQKSARRLAHFAESAGRKVPVPFVERRASADAALPFFLAVLVLLGMAYGGYTWWRVAQAEANRGNVTYDIGPPITDFELTERSGKPIRSADMKGKVWVVSYFFTSCPGECIRLNRNIQVMHMLPELKDVHWLSITCDPDNDSIETLAKYADSLDADPIRWLFARGDMEYTSRVALGMNMYLGRQTHQNYAIVIDKEGKIRGTFDGTSTADCEKMKKLLVELEAEPFPPADVREPPATITPAPEKTDATEKAA
jgi:cytochrome oxidase Cu insertion factor (SCO1/SenC/PrrC family)